MDNREKFVVNYNYKSNSSRNSDFIVRNIRKILWRMFEESRIQEKGGAKKFTLY